MRQIFSAVMIGGVVLLSASSGVCGYVIGQDSLGTQDASSGRFTHASGVFSIIPPVGFKQVTALEDGVQMINLIDRSFVTVSVAAPVRDANDADLIARFNDEKFRTQFARTLEQGSSAVGLRVVNSQARSVKGIAAWEFTAEASSGGRALQEQFIIFYRNTRQFLVIIGMPLPVSAAIRSAIEDSLETLEVR